MQIREAAEYIGVSQITIRDHIKRGHIKAEKDPVTQRVTIDDDSIRDFKENFKLSVQAGRKGKGAKKNKPAAAPAAAAAPQSPSNGHKPGAGAGTLRKAVVAAEAVLAAFPDAEGAELTRKILSKAGVGAGGSA